MARRLEGSIRIKDGCFEASVPKRRGARGRTYEYFDMRETAERWCAAAVNALYRGEPVPTGDGFRSEGLAMSEVSEADAADQHFVARAARRWHNERYDQLRLAEPERAKKVNDILRLHVLPYFTTMLSRPDRYSRQIVVDFLLRLVGSRDAFYPVADAARIAGKSERQIRRLLANGELVATKHDATGGRLVRLHDLEKYLGVPRLAAGYAPSYVGEIFSVWKQVEAFMVADGSFERTMTEKLQVPRVDAGARRRAPKKRRSCVTLPEVYEIAQRLHLVHQLVVWMLRVCGLRISEAYGIRVGDILDPGTAEVPGIIAVERQGGRPFLTYDANGNVVSSDEKDSLKTEGSVRVLMVPSALMMLIQLVIDVIHTDPETGRVELSARLVPGLQRPGVSGQAAFRGALGKAVGTAQADGDIEAMFVPHELRAALITDLAYSDVQELLRRRYAGHEVGSDVHAGYIRDHRDDTRFREVADETQRSILDTVGSLIVPTRLFPLFGRSHPIYARLVEVRSRLIDAGALLEVLDSGDEPLLDAADVAIELGCHESHARRLMRSGVFSTDNSTGQRRVALCDLEAYLDTKLPNLRDVADRTGIDYHRLYRIVGQLDLQLDRDPVSDEFAIDEVTQKALLAEVDRVDALRARACTVVDAASRLHKAHSTVRKMIRAGDLTVDAETDASGARFITNASIDEYLELA